MDKNLLEILEEVPQGLDVRIVRKLIDIAINDKEIYILITKVSMVLP